MKRQRTGPSDPDGEAGPERKNQTRGLWARTHPPVLQAQACETCGQELPDEGGTWLGQPSEHHHVATAPRGTKPPGIEKKMLLVLASAVAAWAAFVGVGRLVSPDDGVDDAAAERQAERAARDEAADSAAEPDPTSVPTQSPQLQFDIESDLDTDYEAADAAPGVPVDIDAVGEPASDAIALEASERGERPINRVQLERFQRQLGQRDSNALVAYRSAKGVVIIDLRSGTSEVVDATSGATAIGQGELLLRSGANVYAIDPETQAVGLVVDDSSILVTDTRDGAIYFVPASGLDAQFPPVQVRSSSGERTTHGAPDGYRLTAFDGLGLVAVPEAPGGDSLIADAASFRILGELGRVLDANRRGLLEERCITPIDCFMTVTDIADGGIWQVPADFVELGDSYVLSPDGRSLLRYTADGFAEAYESIDESKTWVIGRGMEDAAWDPESNFVTWLDLADEPILNLMFLDERDWLAIGLADLEAPPPVGPELIVFTPGSTLPAAG